MSGGAGERAAERQFGPYRLIRRIATGGMAEIHLATTSGLGFEKQVALKMIHPNLSSDEQFVEMLIDEAKICVHLQHVNIVQVFDLGQVDGTYYIAMEYVDGADLYQVLRKASEKDLPMPCDVAAYIAKEVANGLDHAHRKLDDAGRPLGIVHRDMSPQNVLLSRAGEVKIVDFGIAKATSRARQTAAGVIKGKYYYMSPEQAWGEPLDGRSDLFSTGIVLHEMLVGQMLYLEDDLQRLLERVRHADVRPPSVHRPDVPDELEGIVMKALARRPADRWQSAQDLGVALERWLYASAPDFTPARVAAFVEEALAPPAASARPPRAAPPSPAARDDEARARPDRRPRHAETAEVAVAPSRRPTPPPARAERAPSSAPVEPFDPAATVEQRRRTRDPFEETLDGQSGPLDLGELRARGRGPAAGRRAETSTPPIGGRLSEPWADPPSGGHGDDPVGDATVAPSGGGGRPAEAPPTDDSADDALTIPSPGMFRPSGASPASVVAAVLGRSPPGPAPGEPPVPTRRSSPSLPSPLDPARTSAGSPFEPQPAPAPPATRPSSGVPVAATVVQPAPRPSAGVPVQPAPRPSAGVPVQPAPRPSAGVPVAASVVQPAMFSVPPAAGEMVVPSGPGETTLPPGAAEATVPPGAGAMIAQPPTATRPHTDPAGGLPWPAPGGTLPLAGPALARMRRHAAAVFDRLRTDRRFLARTAIMATVVTLVVAAGVRLAVRLDAPRRTLVPLEVTSIPAGATVTIDGRPAGTTPIVVEEVERGATVRVRLELPGHEPWEGEAVIPRTGDARIVAPLEPGPGR